MNYTQRRNENEKVDIEAELKSADAGFVWLLKEHSECQGAVKLARLIHEWLIGIPDLWAGYKDQISRAVESVVCNLFEGLGRARLNQLAVFYGYSRGSVYEVRGLLLIAPIPVPKDITDLCGKVCGDIDKAHADICRERLARL